MIERLRALIINAQSRKEVIQAFATMRLATIQNGIPDSGSDARMSQIQEALACRAAMEEVRDSFVSSAMAAQLIIDALTEEVLKLANQAVGD